MTSAGPSSRGSKDGTHNPPYLDGGKVFGCLKCHIPWEVMVAANLSYDDHPCGPCHCGKSAWHVFMEGGKEHGVPGPRGPRGMIGPVGYGTIEEHIEAYRRLSEQEYVLQRLLVKVGRRFKFLAIEPELTAEIERAVDEEL